MVIQKPERKALPLVQGGYLRFIRDEYKRAKTCPSLGELMHASGDTKSTVRSTIKLLIGKGLLEKTEQRHRNLRVTPEGHKALRSL